jgi:hypothetical protein
VESYDSSEAGRGKTLLDAHFAVLKRAMRAEVVRGAGEKDIVDPRSMFEAAARLDTRGPPCATTVALVKPINLGLPSDVKPITDMMSASKKNTIGIRRTASVAFERGAAAFSVSEMSGMPGAAMQPATVFQTNQALLKWKESAEQHYVAGTGTRFSRVAASPMYIPKQKEAVAVQEHTVATEGAAAVIEESMRKFYSSVGRANAATETEAKANAPAVADVFAHIATGAGVCANIDGASDSLATTYKHKWGDGTFGLKSHHGKRRDRGAVKVDSAIKQALRGMFNYGKTGVKVTPEEAYERLCRMDLIRYCWEARLVINPDKIKAMFSSWAQKDKKELKAKNKAAASATAAAAAPAALPTVPTAPSVVPTVAPAAAPAVDLSAAAPSTVLFPIFPQ